jgi:SAM-dependent methyltransferase
MTSVFGKGYASTYDTLYQDKDYGVECDRIGQIIRDNRHSPVQSILDLGCGTGNHALRLAQRGYSVTGVDRSPEMLEVAQRKSRESNLDCKFIQSDIRTFKSEQKFDVVIMMFAVLGYLNDNEDILGALNTVKNHLSPGGLFICDVWYGPAVLHQKPGERMRVTDSGNTKIIRASSGELDSLHHIVTVRFRLWKIEGDRLVDDISEEHQMRFFFPQELDLLFRMSGLSIKRMLSFPDIEHQPSEDTWNICVVSTPAIQNNKPLNEKQ